MQPRTRLFEFKGCWLVKRQDSRNLHIYWCRPGTRRVRRQSTFTSNLEQAKERLIAFAEQRERPRRATPDTVSIHEALNHYIEHDLAGRPGQARAIVVLKHVDAFLRKFDLAYVADMTMDMQDQYVAWRRTELRAAGHTASNGTIKRELDVLKAALRAYWKRGRLSTVPYIRSAKPPPARQRFLSLEECRRLMDACVEDHTRLFVLMALHTLQRPGAILGLRCEQVDLTHGLIDFLPPGEMPSNKRKPVVPITPTLRPLLEKAIATAQSGHVIEYKGLSVKSIKTAFKATCRRAGVTGVTLYTLRHTGATWAASRGVPMRQLAGMMGHSEITMTERYAKHSPDFLQDVAGALDDLFGERTDTPSTVVRHGSGLRVVTNRDHSGDRRRARPERTGFQTEPQRSDGRLSVQCLPSKPAKMST